MDQITQKDIDIFAQKILKDYDAKNPGTMFKDKIKISNEVALLIQSTVTKLRKKRGEEVIGYKIGCVSKETQKKMGLTQPAWGTLWKSELFVSGVELNKRDYVNPAMEAEFGVKLNRDIDPKLVSFDYILDSIESIYPLIEIHNLVFNGDEPHGAELLANNALHAGVILGPETKLIENNKITDLELIYDNKKVDTWTEKKWPYDMLSEVEWLVKEQAKIKNTLKKNDLILTGAYGFPVPIDDKNLIEVKSSAFGQVKALFNNVP
jgi:2-keto-4-pentenoate hydratase